MQQRKRISRSDVFIAIASVLIVGATSIPKDYDGYRTVTDWGWTRALADYGWDRAFADFTWGRTLADFTWGRLTYD